MGEVKKDLILQWFKKADSDLLNIENNLNSERMPIDTICFHIQQSIEKYLKALLIYNDIPIKKTHDLIELLNLLEENYPEIDDFYDELLNISLYSVIARYPEDTMSSYVEPSLEETKEAYEIALKVKEIVLSKMKDIL